ncbi:MAG: dockerin type I repeat-containing protein [Ruminococcus sp.]|nr:dockerin type I repeat-containing protein [Ruminococcus sp.]
MKEKWIAAITGTAMAISAFMPHASAVAGIIAEAADTVSLGDIDSSGHVDTADITLLQNYLTGGSPLNSPIKSYADLTGDGKVNVFQSVEKAKQELGFFA